MVGFARYDANGLMIINQHVLQFFESLLNLIFVTLVSCIILQINKKAAALGSVMVKVQEFDGVIAINNLVSDHSFTLFLHPNTTLLTPVLWGRASVGSNGQMVNVGDFVHYTESREPSVSFSNGYLLISSCICRFKWEYF